MFKQRKYLKVNFKCTLQLRAYGQISAIYCKGNVVIRCLLKIDTKEYHGKTQSYCCHIPIFCMIAALGLWYQSSN